MYRALNDARRIISGELYLNFKTFIDLVYSTSHLFYYFAMLYYAEEKDNMLIGVVGASYSSVTQPLATATLALNLPLFSYAASNKG